MSWWALAPSFFIGAILLLQNLPTLPGQVRSEGTSAVLYLILLFFAALGMVLKWGPGLLVAWRAPGAAEEKERAEQERQRTDLVVKALVAATEALERKTARDSEIATQVARLASGLHERTAPAISGLSYAFLILARERKLADAQASREEQHGYPPMQTFTAGENGEKKS